MSTSGACTATGACTPSSPLGHGLVVGEEAVWLLMRKAGLQGLSGRPQYRRIPEPANRRRPRRPGLRPERTRPALGHHPNREGKEYCAVVLDVFSRRVVGWSIDSSQNAALVTNALGMAIGQRKPNGTVIHSDQGTQFTSWAFTRGNWIRKRRRVVTEDRLLTVQEVAERLGTSVAFPRRLILERRIRYVKVSRLVRIPESAVAAMIEAGTVEPIERRPRRRSRRWVA